jgi:tryptophan-rich sensory protein
MFTDTNVNTLVTWFTAVLVFIFSSSCFMSRKFRIYYQYLRNVRNERTGQPLLWLSFSPRFFGIVWMLIAGFLITSMTLWTMNYSACNNDYYIAVVALTLFVLLCLASWAPLLVKMGRPGYAFVSLMLGTCAAIAALILMALTVTKEASATCIADKTSGILACVFYGLPILWYLMALILTWQMVQLRTKMYFKKLWPVIKQQWKDSQNQSYGYDAQQQQNVDKYTPLRSMIKTQ